MAGGAIQRYHRFCFSPCAGVIDTRLRSPLANMAPGDRGEIFRARVSVFAIGTGRRVVAQSEEHAARNGASLLSSKCRVNRCKPAIVTVIIP